jgi:Rha family phage regulatory protein
MTKLILLPNDQQGMGIFASKDIICTSRAMAEIFNKRHTHVLEAISNATEPESGLSEKFSLINFKESSYKDSTGRKLPMYLLTRDGFSIIAFGFNGKKAMKFKESYINRFNEMELALKDRQLARMECHLLTDAIKSSHDPAKPYHFSNEMNMLLTIVAGKTAKQLKQERNLPDTAEVRDYLSPSEIKLLASLQPVAAFLNANKDEYAERKKMLAEYADKLKTPRLEKTA